jgi:hypothetical protein
MKFSQVGVGALVLIPPNVHGVLLHVTRDPVVKTGQHSVSPEGSCIPLPCGDDQDVLVLKEAPKLTLPQRLKDWFLSL